MATTLDNFGHFLLTKPSPGRRNKKASAQTVRGYLADVTAFLAWWQQSDGYELTEDSLRADPYAINLKVLQDYLGWLEVVRKCGVTTILRHAASLRAFTFYLQDAKVIQHDPSRGLDLPTSQRADPKGLSDAQRARFEAVFQSPWLDKTTKRKRLPEQLENAETRLFRDRAMAFVMLYAGPRVEEVAALDMADIEINARSGSLHIRKGKGNKERTTPLALPAREALSIWLEARTKIGVPHGALFVQLRSNAKGEYLRLGDRSIQNIISEAGVRAGLEKLGVSVTPHVLRHTCAYMLRAAGVQPEVRARFLGHSLETAMRYGAPKMQEMERAADILDKFATVKFGDSSKNGT
jgi:site-specific recombinase XerD